MIDINLPETSLDTSAGIEHKDGGRHSNSKPQSPVGKRIDKQTWQWPSVIFGVLNDGDSGW